MTLVRCENVSVRFSSRQVGLAGVSLALELGELVMVHGAALSGRTTLLEVLTGVRRPTSGTVTFGRAEPAEWLGREHGIAWARVREPDAWPGEHGERLIDQVAFPVRRQRSRRAAELAAADRLAEVGIDDLADELPDRLSDAARVRAALARALMTTPELIVCDRPLIGLIAPERDRLLELMRTLTRSGRTLVLTVDEVHSGADRLLTLHRGELRGSPPLAGGTVVDLRDRRAR